MMKVIIIGAPKDTYTLVVDKMDGTRHISEFTGTFAHAIGMLEQWTYEYDESEVREAHLYHTTATSNKEVARLVPEKWDIDNA